MLQTTDDMGPTPTQANLDTLVAEDAEPDANLDDRLLRRDLKSRIFGASTTVRIGRYEVLRRIGRGGMGTVYVAHDPELDRKVALKVLRPDRRSGRDRMLQEARALARLSHPNVVTVHEVGLHDERVFVAMELIEGQTLRTWLEQSPPRTELYGVFVQAARGLRAAHRAGLVHRDFKPDNVLIGDDGRVRVVDFGVVKATDSLDADDLAEAGPDSTTSLPELTLTGQLLGTPAYMAAEQFLGQSVDARTDIFAFCASLYEALASRRPYPGEDAAEVSRAVLAGRFIPLPADAPRELTTLVEQGLSRDAEARPRSMDGLIGALEAQTTTTATAPPRRTSLRMLALASGSMVLLGTGILLMQPTRSHGTGDEPPPTRSSMAADQSQRPHPTDAAFEALVTVPDDAQRRAAAEGFLEHFGETASPARLAIAHSILGDILWRSSCPDAMLGLCIDEQDTAVSKRRCREPLRGAIVRRARDPELSDPALEHLDATLSLAGIDRPEDPEERRLFDESIGRARVQRADAKLEEFFNIELPKGLDFSDDSEIRVLSSEALKLYYTQANRTAKELILDYAAVIEAKDPRSTITAALRTAMLSEAFSENLGNLTPPTEGSEHDRLAYCKAVDEYTDPPLRKARDAYTYCVKKADEYGMSTPEVDMCRSRLKLIEAIE